MRKLILTICSLQLVAVLVGVFFMLNQDLSRADKAAAPLVAIVTLVLAIILLAPPFILALSGKWLRLALVLTLLLPAYYLWLNVP
jgi:uncharacterized membrane protein